MKRSLLTRLIPVLLLTLSGGWWFTGCATNPVTGQRELAFISERQEIALGEQYFGPTKQTEGGPYATLPELTVYVNEVGQRLAAVSDRPQLPYEFVVLNSPVPNAWALPGGKIAINRGLLEVLDNEAELAAVLGHEIVHAAARHSAQRMERATVAQAVTAAAMLGVASTVSDRGNRDLILGAAHTSAALGAHILFARYSRDAEEEADYFGMRYMSAAGYDPMGAVTLQEKFVELYEGRNPNWLEGLFASHPPSQRRVELNRRTLEELPEGGKLGREEYQTQMQRLREAAPAYAKYDEAAESMRRGNRPEALRLLDQASALLPQEAQFDALRARVLVLEGRRPEALQSIQTAIRKNPNYFAYHMMEGQILNELGNRDQARASFQRSNQLLPTAEAQAALGFIALDRGETQTAMQFLTSAAQYQNTEAGRAAREALIPLQMRNNPGNFIDAQVRINEEGRLQVQVANRSPQPFQLIVVEVVTADRRRQELVVSRPIANGQAVVLQTNLGPYNPEADVRNIARVSLVRAVVD